MAGVNREGTGRGLVTLDELREGIQRIEQKIDGVIRYLTEAARRTPQDAPSAAKGRQAPERRAVPEERRGLREARKNGTRAGRGQGALRDNPYPRDDPRFDEWTDAFLEGRRARCGGGRHPSPKQGRGLSPEARKRRAASRAENAREKGRQAARDGKPASACPYAAMGGFRTWWLEGHAEETG